MLNVFICICFKSWQIKNLAHNCARFNTNNKNVWNFSGPSPHQATVQSYESLRSPLDVNSLTYWIDCLYIERFKTPNIRSKIYQCLSCNRFLKTRMESLKMKSFPKSIGEGALSTNTPNISTTYTKKGRLSPTFNLQNIFF